MVPQRQHISWEGRGGGGGGGASTQVQVAGSRNHDLLPAPPERSLAHRPGRSSTPLSRPKPRLEAAGRHAAMLTRSVPAAEGGRLRGWLSPRFAGCRPRRSLVVDVSKAAVTTCTRPAQVAGCSPSPSTACTIRKPEKAGIKLENPGIPGKTPKKAGKPTRSRGVGPHRCGRTYSAVDEVAPKRWLILMTSRRLIFARRTLDEMPLTSCSYNISRLISSW